MDTGVESRPAQGGGIFWLGPVLEALAVASYESGIADQGAEYDRRLIELWADADTELVARVQAARDRVRAAGAALP